MSSGSAMAAGYQLAEYSATGLGRAYAGEAAMADNASAQWRNPAMLTYLEGTQVSGGILYVDPNIDVTGTASKGGNGAYTESNDIAHSAPIPNFYLSHRINESWAAGLAFGSNYGMETELSEDFSSLHYGNEANVMTVEAVANLGYKLNDQWSFGAGVRLVAGEGHFGASSDAITGSMDRLKYMEGDDISWGYVLGTTWQINDNHRIGFAYKSEVMMDFDGHAEGLVYTGNTTDKIDGELSIPLPATIELASYHQLNQQWAVHASINWTQWSKFESLVAEFDDGTTDLIKEENWEDNFRFAVGTTYAMTPKLTLRSGIAYDMSAVSDENRTTTIPETDRTWLSAGASYQFTEQFTLDGGLTYIFAKTASISETDYETSFGSFDGEISGDVWIAGVQANYRF
nr:outer membrane protein transport protein [Vibrio hippocampi]